MNNKNNKNTIKKWCCDDKIHSFFVNAVKAHLSIIVCGAPGTGKTDLVKYMTKYIPANERATIIENNPEIEYSNINPGKECIEIQINDSMDYDTAIELSMKQLSKWLIMDEIRGREVVNFLKSLSTGMSGITTLHTDSVKKAPKRIKNMSTDVNENDIFNLINVIVQVKSVIKENQEIKHYISELALLYHNVDTGENETVMLYDNEKFLDAELPSDIEIKFKEAGITNLFQI